MLCQNQTLCLLFFDRGDGKRLFAERKLLCAVFLGASAENPRLWRGLQFGRQDYSPRPQIALCGADFERGAEMERLKTLAAQIHAANVAYHGKDAPIMPDAAYDALRRDYKRIRKALLLGFAERFAQAAAELRDAKPEQGDLFG